MNKRTPFITFLFLISLVTASVLGLQTAATPVAALRSSQATAKATQTPVIVPFELNNRHIILKGKINSQPVEFVLDTGDQVAIIDLDLAKRLNVKFGDDVRVGGAGAAILTGAEVKDTPFTIDGLPGFSQPVRIAIP